METRDVSMVLVILLPFIPQITEIVSTAAQTVQFKTRNMIQSEIPYTILVNPKSLALLMAVSEGTTH